MRIGIPGGGTTFDRAVEQAVEAEQSGFASVWYPGTMLGDPLVAITLSGRATSKIELGTAVLNAYGCHPTVMAQRVAAARAAIGRPLTIGIGPSHQSFVEGSLGLSYAHPGRYTEEYTAVLAALLRGETVEHDGEEFRVRVPGPADAGDVSILVAALAPRLLRVAGESADGTILWMANARAISTHIVGRIQSAAAAAGRPAPRVVCGLPIVVHDDVDEARSVAATQWGIYGTLPNYQRVLACGGISSPEEACLIGNEEVLAQQVDDLFAAGATDLWLNPFPVGHDRAASRQRTRAFLAALAGA